MTESNKRLVIGVEPLIGYPRTSFSSRVFHQIVGFSPKSSQSENYRVTSYQNGNEKMKKEQLRH